MLTISRKVTKMDRFVPTEILIHFRVVRVERNSPARKTTNPRTLLSGSCTADRICANDWPRVLRNSSTSTKARVISRRESKTRVRSGLLERFHQRDYRYQEHYTDPVPIDKNARASSFNRMQPSVHLVRFSVYGYIEILPFRFTAFLLSTLSASAVPFTRNTSFPLPKNSTFSGTCSALSMHRVSELRKAFSSFVSRILIAMHSREWFVCRIVNPIKLFHSPEISTVECFRQVLRENREQHSWTGPRCIIAGFRNASMHFQTHYRAFSFSFF